MHKRYHVTTFGCQMNAHDSERIQGMLESLGYTEAPSRGEADLILFNTCSIREAADTRLTAHLGEAKRLKRENPAKIVGVGGCWAQSVKEEVFSQFPFVDVAFGPGQVHRLAEFLTSDSLTAQGFFEFEGFTGHLPAKREQHRCRGQKLSHRKHIGGLVDQPLEEVFLEGIWVVTASRDGRKRFEMSALLRLAEDYGVTNAHSFSVPLEIMIRTCFCAS